ncbi:MAG: hypothetical protein ISR58_11195 [Anaerolineales bacterium]|nr:hypothetical protein [Chloroflexota bacterium]MBL6981740.1 hypothetical protein [Anaerolineales bacterium]
MKEQISRRDWERLSAYVDDQLTPHERSRVEERLGNEPRLRDALDDLRMTRAAVKSLPQMPAPRNFTLTPEMAGQELQRSPRLFATFRLASVISTVLLVMVILGDLIGFGRVGMLPAQEMAAPAAPMEMEANEAVEEPETSAKEAEADVGKVEPEEEAQPQPEAMAEAALEAESADAEGIEAEEVQPQAEALAEAVPEDTVNDESVEAEPELATERGMEEDEVAGEGEAYNVEPTLQPASTQGAQTTVPEGGLSDDLAADSEIPQVVAVSKPISTIRVFEILLGVIAIVSGVAAIYFRRRKHQ